MSANVCLRCLARPTGYAGQVSVRSANRNGTQAGFSTSAAFAAPPLKKKAAPPSKIRQGATKSYKQVKGARAAGGRPPASGERKALRKRIVLSNTNALEVQGMADLSRQNMGDDSIHNQVLGINGDVVDQLRAAEAFKPTQGWSMFRRPATLIRKETLQMAQDLDRITRSRSSDRKVIHGEKSSGKSVLALQAMAMAFMRGWVVIHIPEAQDVTIGHTAYVPYEDPSTNETIYIQPDYTATLLSSIAKANHAILSKLQLNLTHDELPIPIQSNISLVRFAELGAQDPEIAYPIFRALIAELTSPSTSSHEGGSRPPVLFTLDALSHAMRPSNYLSADLSHIHAHDLAILKTFTSFLSGSSSLPNGGMVLGIDSSSNRPTTPALDFAIEVATARQDGKRVPLWDAHKKVDRRVLEALKDVQAQEVTGLSRDEAKGVMEYYARSGMLRRAVDNRLVQEKWTISGGGIIGELERSTVTMCV